MCKGYSYFECHKLYYQMTNAKQQYTQFVRQKSLKEFFPGHKLLYKSALISVCMYDLKRNIKYFFILLSQFGQKPYIWFWLVSS